jgi:hypothetical protein
MIIGGIIIFILRDAASAAPQDSLPAVAQSSFSKALKSEGWERWTIESCPSRRPLHGLLRRSAKQFEIVKNHNL